jgi:hypothetical protein
MTMDFTTQSLFGAGYFDDSGDVQGKTTFFYTLYGTVRTNEEGVVEIGQFGFYLILSFIYLIRFRVDLGCFRFLNLLSGDFMFFLLMH